MAWWSDNEIELLKREYPNKSNKELEEFFPGRTHENIKHKANKLGLKKNPKSKIIKTPSKIMIKDSFKNILETNTFTKEFCYYLGYFWADGYIRQNNLQIEITKDDGDDIKDIFINLVQMHITYRNKPNRKPQMRFSTNSPFLVKLLKDFGKYSKSSESHNKILEWIPKEYRRFFILGLSDGDGCFYSKNNSTQFTIASNYNQDWSGLLDELSEFNFRIHKEITKRGNSSVIRITDLNIIKQFIHYLYDGHDLGLKRKRNKVFEILNKKSKVYDYSIVVNNICYSSVYEYCLINNCKPGSIFPKLNSPKVTNFKWNEQVVQDGV